MLMILHGFLSFKTMLLSQIRAWVFVGSRGAISTHAFPPIFELFFLKCIYLLMCSLYSLFYVV